MQEVHTSKKSCFNLLKNIQNDYVTDDMYSRCEILNITQRDGGKKAKQQTVAIVDESLQTKCFICFHTQFITLWLNPKFNQNWFSNCDMSVHLLYHKLFQHYNKTKFIFICTFHRFSFIWETTAKKNTTRAVNHSSTSLKSCDSVTEDVQH